MPGKCFAGSAERDRGFLEHLPRTRNRCGGPATHPPRPGVPGLQRDRVTAPDAVWTCRVVARRRASSCLTGAPDARTCSPPSTRSSRRFASRDRPDSCHRSRARPTARTAGNNDRCTSVSLRRRSFVNSTSGLSASSDRTAKMSRPLGWLHHEVRSDSPVTSPTTLGSSLSCLRRSPLSARLARTRSRACMLVRLFPAPDAISYCAYCATPLPNDQFSFAISTRLTKTSSGRTPGRSARFRAMALKRARFCSSVRPALIVI